MKKLILFFTAVCVLFSGINAFAQVSTIYTFTDSLGLYNEKTGDTVVASATHTSIDPFQLNDVTYGPNRIPFTFVFNGYDYNNFMINSNGFITFGPTAPVLANYGPVSSSEVYEGAISAFGLDLIGLFGTTVDFTIDSPVLTNVANFKGVIVGRHITAATGIPAATTITSFDANSGTITMSANATSSGAGLVVQIAAGSIVRSTEGVSPYRVHTIQFKNFRQYLIIGVNDNFNFQIKLFETTGVIHVVYGNMVEYTTSGMFGQTGLRGFTNTDFNNRTNFSTANWATSTAGATNAATSMLSSTVFPVSGQTYIWTPLESSLPVEITSFISLVRRSDVILNWTTATETNNSRFDIERSAGNGQWQNTGTINGYGTSLSPVNYSFTDRNLNSGVYNYRLKQTDFNGNFTYFNMNSEVRVGLPEKFDLLQNYPNPFNPSTRINYDLSNDVKVTLKIYDISGREVSTLINEFQTAGYYSINYNAGSLTTGIYFYNLTANGITLTKKMLLVK